jgi:hypothetical protein
MNVGERVVGSARQNSRGKVPRTKPGESGESFFMAKANKPEDRRQLSVGLTENPDATNLFGKYRALAKTERPIFIEDLGYADFVSRSRV